MSLNGANLSGEEVHQVLGMVVSTWSIDYFPLTRRQDLRSRVARWREISQMVEPFKRDCVNITFFGQSVRLRNIVGVVTDFKPGVRLFISDNFITGIFSVNQHNFQEISLSVDSLQKQFIISHPNNFCEHVICVFNDFGLCVCQ
ncbi:hypothetical protein WICPIJ_007230 [Wickerhamomyces pijperi]|uniref:Uncharacterized protein n=1 Tax=Wickerhamomyces pijperi TaxID=599730 RepID=A0A9P8Q0J1_WICPI|nr:hypothetical protein WICPIJ_007230 [Wickerhamomyces pijperi]